MPHARPSIPQVQHGGHKQATKERKQCHLTVRKKVVWCRAMQFHHFPKEIVILKNARISNSIPTTRVFRK